MSSPYEPITVRLEVADAREFTRAAEAAGFGQSHALRAILKPFVDCLRRDGGDYLTTLIRVRDALRESADT